MTIWLLAQKILAAARQELKTCPAPVYLHDTRSLPIHRILVPLFSVNRQHEKMGLQQ